MNVYLVGGAVRDQLLNLPVKDKDWVVIGGDPQSMLNLGYKQVGADFPVFLHPETGEEYALGRTERKSGQGYTGFVTDFSKDVTLEDDLLRRDLTINAIAMDASGVLIDPYDGRADLEAKILRHVSDAFAEDPLRVLRLARFYARYRHLGFTIAPETKALCIQLALGQELLHLTHERVWQETARAMAAPSAHAYFEFLQEIGALAKLFPEIDALFGVPQPEQHHPEIDCGIHAMLCLQRAKELSDDVGVWYAALTHDLGKALTPQAQWPKHHGHEKTGLKPLKALNKRLRVPKEVADLALLTCEFHTHVHKAFELRAETVLKVLKRCDAFRRPERFQKLLLASKADSRGRTGFEHVPYTQADFFSLALSEARKLDIAPLRAQGLEGKELGDAIDRERANLIQELDREPFKS